MLAGHAARMDIEANARAVLVSQRIVRLRGRHVILDGDLAVLYGVPTRALMQAVKRNIDRFPQDFIIQVNELEWQALRSQFVISNRRGGRRYLPWAFTEHGALQAANVLKSDQATAVSLLVIRAFVSLRRWSETNRELATRLAELERLSGEHDHAIRGILASLRQLIAQEEGPRRSIGFTADLTIPGDNAT